MKKLSFIVLVLTLVAVIATLCGCSASYTVGQNILASENTVSEEDDTLSLVFTDEKLSTYWSTDGSASGAVISAVDNGIQLNTSSGGYAVLSQEVKLRPNSYYKISYTYASSSMSMYNTSSESFVGFFATFLEDQDFNMPTGKGTSSDEASTEERLTNKSGEKTFYFKNDDTREATFAFCLGTEEKPVKCDSVIIKTVKLERVEKAAVGVDDEKIMSMASDEYGAEEDFNILYVVLGAVGTLMIGYAFYMVRARVKAKEEAGTCGKVIKYYTDNKWTGITTAIGVTLLVRLIILAVQTALQNVSLTVFQGYAMDQSYTFGNWLATYGTTRFFEYNTTATLMPFGLFFEALAGLIDRLCHVINVNYAADNPIAYAVTLRAFAILADVGVAALIYSLVANKRGRVNGTIYACLYAFIPAIFTMSTAWGAMDSIAVFFVVLTFYFILNKQYIASCAAYFVAALTAPIALIVSPFVLLYAGYLVYVGFKTKKYSNLVKVLSCMAGGIVLFYLVSLPFTINQIQAGDGVYAFNSYISAVKGANVYTANAFNFQGMIGNNFKTVSTQSTFITVVFVVFIVAVLAVPYFKTKSRLTLVGVSAAGALMYWIFCNDLSQNGLLIVLPLLLIFAALTEDKRVYAITSVLSAFMFVNTSYVYMVTGYTSTGINHISYDGNPVMYIMGAFMMVIIIAFVIIGYDVTVSRKRVEQLSLRVPYGEYVASVAKNMYIGVKNAGVKVGTFSKNVVDALKEDAAERKAKKAAAKNSENAENDDSDDSDKKN